jgi:hypothetical protein
VKKLLLLFLLASNNLFAQVVGTQPSPNATYTSTSNLLNPTVNAWTGTVQGQNGGLSGGTTPAFNPGTNTIIFGYTTATAMQTIAINQALSGTGIQVGGYNYSWNINNDPATGQYGTLTGSVVLKDSGGNALQTYNYNYPQQAGGFITYSGTQWFNQNYSLLGLSSLELSFTGKDAKFWAGYYGPQVRNPSLSLQYTVDPCVANPGYSPSCPGYNATISGNLLPGTTGAQAYAIASALSFAGAGATIHGFDYGYTYNVPGRQCAMFDLFGLCLTGWNYSDAGVATVITDSNNATIYSDTTTHNGGNNGVSGNYTNNYRLSSSLPISSLGAFAMSPWTLGTAAISNMWSQAVYTADPCVSNPLSSQSCPGYAAAYLNQQCTLNALYDPACPGYQTAQCNINPLFSQSCPGYQAAYYAQQCTLNALYDTGCPGYATAYYNYQCSVNPLYHTGCPGYQQAYFTQQCSLNGLYSRECPNYSQAYAVQQALNNVSTNTTTNNSTLSQTTEPNKIAITTDPTVNNVITTTATSVNPSQSATTTVPLVSTPSATTIVANQETKKEEKKNVIETSTSTGSSSTSIASSQESSTDKNAPRTVRQELQERRIAAARANAIEQGKQLAENVGKAASLEQQIAVQNVVIAAMGYTPGFDVYNKAIIPDGVGYKPFSVYNNQRNVDNPIGRRFMSGSDRLHNEMVESQYKK